jgi:hypothetical protein
MGSRRVMPDAKVPITERNTAGKRYKVYCSASIGVHIRFVTHRNDTYLTTIQTYKRHQHMAHFRIEQYQLIGTASAQNAKASKSIFIYAVTRYSGRCGRLRPHPAEGTSNECLIVVVVATVVVVLLITLLLLIIRVIILPSGNKKQLVVERKFYSYSLTA